MKMKPCLAVALLAGTVITSSAQAQRGVVLPKQLQAQGHRYAAKKTVDGVTYPVEYRPVRRVDGRIEGLGDWRPYRPAGSDAGTPTICFDAYHNAGGAAPSTPPEAGRWIFSWDPTFVIFNYTASAFATPINNVLPASIPIGAKYFDYLYYENNGTAGGDDEYLAIFTSESYFDTAAPNATWGIFNGWQFHYTAVTVGFYYSTLSLTDPNIWPLPVDGNGGLLVSTTRDAAGAVPAQQYQFAQWGTQEHTTPAPVPAKVGTSGPNQWDDESTGATCAVNLASNVANGIYEIACENYSWDYGPNYQPEPFTMCFDLGFDALTATGACCTSVGCQVLTSVACTAASGTYNGDNTTCSGPGQPSSCCYANCDGSTTSPCLNVLDFGCFLNAFAANNPYANCDHSTTPPVLNVLDFGCFLHKFAGGCSSC